MARLKTTPRKLWLRALGCLVVAATGILLSTIPDTWFQSLSFDLPFRLRADRLATNAIIVYFNQGSLNAGIQSGVINPRAFSPPLRTNLPPDRRIYVELLDRLKQSGASLVFFDCNFNTPRPGEDEPFAHTIREHSPVILGHIYGAPVIQQPGSGVGLAGRPVLPLNQTLQAVVTNFGLLALDPSPSDNVARKLLTIRGRSNSAVFVAAQIAGFTGLSDEERWINYYGPAGSIDSVELTEALKPESASKFRGRAVFVGGDDPTEPDLHPTPYSRLGSPGVEILATSYLNLVEGTSLTQWSRWWQTLLIAAWGIVSVVILLPFRPRNALLLTPILMLIPLVAGIYSQWVLLHWWCWAIPAIIQSPIAGLWAAFVNRFHPWPPVIFFCYRREAAAHRHGIAEALERRGYASASDVDRDPTANDYRDAAFALIDSVPNFILILSIGCLEEIQSNLKDGKDDEVLLEIQHAHETGKNFIPVTIESYEIHADMLPEHLRKHLRADVVNWTQKEPETTIGKIVRRLRGRPLFGTREHKKTSTDSPAAAKT